MFLYIMLATWLGCYLLHCLRGIFAECAPRVLSGVANSGLYQSCVQGLLMCCQIIASVLSLRLAFSSHWYVFFITATSSICRWYIQRRGLLLHDGLTCSSFSSLGFCCLRHSLSRSSFGATFLIYSWILVHSSWIVTQTLTNPHPYSFCFVYSLRV